MSKDFHQQNLRGCSFKAQDLTGANFSNADIRGADFTQAVLIGANFNSAKAGLKQSWLLALQSVLFLLAMLAGFISAYAGTWVGGLLVKIETPTEKLFVASFALILFLGFVLISTFRGIGSELWFFAIAVVTSIVTILALPGTSNSRAYAVLLALVVVVDIAGILIGAIAIAISRILSNIWWRLAIIELVALGGATLGTVAGLAEIKNTFALISAFAITVPAAIALVGLSFYIGRRAIAGDKKYVLIRSIAIYLCTLGGTSFRGANLTNADFSSATLKNTDLRSANLTHTSWYKAKWVEQARVAGTYLENPKVRELVVTKIGQQQHFDQLDLRGLNLERANLTEASLVGAKLSETTLRFSNLSNANLTQAQLYQVDLTGACLTGTIVENWGIATDTILEQIECDYIYRRWDFKYKKGIYRVPHDEDEKFKDGDFSIFISPIIKTLDLYQRSLFDHQEVASTFEILDLYHHKKINPSAVVIALKQLSEQYPEAELEVVALEGQGEEKVRLQAKVVGNANLSALNEDYSKIYRKVVSQLEMASPPDSTKALEDEQAQKFADMISMATQNDKFYLQINNQIINIRESTVTGFVAGDVRDISGTVNLGKINGNANDN